MKRKQDRIKKETAIRIPTIPEADLEDDPSVDEEVSADMPSVSSFPDSVSDTPISAALPVSEEQDTVVGNPYVSRRSEMDPFFREEYLPEREDPFAYVLEDPVHASDPSVPLQLGAHDIDYDVDDSDDSAAKGLQISRTKTLYEPRQKKRTWIKPLHFLIPLAVIAIVVLFLSVFQLGNLEERLASPLTLKGESISNAEFSFMYHYVLLENGVNIFEKGTNDTLGGPGENDFPTLRDYFLDMAAREIQITQILYDDAVSKGYAINDSHKAMAQAYIDWLAVKASDIGVSLDDYIEGYFGTFVTKDLILKNLAKRYFTEDYANGPKLEELKASDLQAEDAYASNPYQYDLVSYRVLRIVYEQTDDNFKATAHLHAQEIIDGIGHDPSKFESVAAGFFSGEAKDKILQPDSTLIPYVRYAYVDDLEWRTWLFDPARTPGDCTIFDDANGFPILLCFSSRERQLEPLRDVRFFYINREDTASGQAGVPDNEIMPAAQTMFDSITGEASMQTLETTYADEITADMMKAVHKSDSYRGELSDALDGWIFDPARVPGDKTILETDTQVILVYYVASSPNPEWYDRVNSFIRMNNYQAFLLEKQVEYPYVFNADGLKMIKDVSQ